MNVILIHGLYLNAGCRDRWRSAIAARGHTAVVESWPPHDGEPGALRASPDPGLRALTLGRVVEHFRGIVRAQSEPPWLIGHSTGGPIVQILLAGGLGRGGVAIDSAPPRGLTSLAWSFLKTKLPLVLGNEPLVLSEADTPPKGRRLKPPHCVSVPLLYVLMLQYSSP